MAKGNCQGCNHAQRSELDAAIESGEKLQAIAARFGISKFCVSRHKKHLAVAMPESDDDSLEAQARKWRERADKLWAQAEIDQDVRGQAQAVAAGLRSVELQARQAEREQEATPDAETSDEFTPQDIAKFDRLLADADERTTQLAIEGAQRLGCSDLYQLFEVCWGNAALKSAVLAFASDWLATQENTGDSANVPQTN